MLISKLNKTDLTNYIASGFTPTEIAMMVGLSRQRVGFLLRKHKLQSLREDSNISPLQKRKKSFFLGKHLYGECAKKFRVKKQNILKAKKWEWSLEMDDLDWCTHCPILGLELLWESPYDVKQENSPSFDRIDCSKGYVKGNVHIISWRANRIKNNGTAEEHRKIADYMERNLL